MLAALPRDRDKDRRAPLWLLLEAGVTIVAASLAVRFLSFERLLATLETDNEAIAPATSQQAYWIRRALTAWGRRVPWRAKCLEQGVAAVWMLPRRGLAASFHYGVARRRDGLVAHAWVMSRNTPVIGHENSADFKELLRTADVRQLSERESSGSPDRGIRMTEGVDR